MTNFDPLVLVTTTGHKQQKLFLANFTKKGKLLEEYGQVVQRKEK